MSRDATWRQLAPRWKTAHKLARLAGANPADHAVLEGVIYLLVAHQRTEDRISLSQLAQEAGFAPHGEPASRHAQRTVGQRLRALSDLGVIVYKPRSGRAKAGLIGLPEARRELFTDTEWRAFQGARPADDDQDVGARPRARAERPTRRSGRASQGARRTTTPNPLGARGDALGARDRGVSDPLGARGNGLGARPRARASEVSEGLPEGYRGASHADDSASGYVDDDDAPTGWEGATLAELLEATATDGCPLAAEVELERRTGMDPIDIDDDVAARLLAELEEDPTK